MRNLACLSILLILASCASFGSAERRGSLLAAITPERARIDALLLEECAGPVTKPEAATDAQVGRLWDRDRSALRECRGGKHALIAAVNVIERR